MSRDRGVIASIGELAMFFAISNFTTVNRAALFAARVAVGAVIGRSDGGIWGVSDPLCHPPDPVPGPVGRGRSRPRCMSLSSGRTALCPCHRRMRRLCRTPVNLIRVDCERGCQVLPENCVHIGERAFALNLDPRRHRAVISCLSSNLRVSLGSSVLALSDRLAAESGHHDD